MVAAVLAVHAVILLGLPQADTAPAPRPQIATLQTRALALPPPPPAPAPPAPPAPAARPAPPRPAPSRPAPPAVERPAEQVPDTPIREHVEPLLPAPSPTPEPGSAQEPSQDAAQEPAQEPVAEAVPQPQPDPEPPAQPPAQGMQVRLPDGQPPEPAGPWAVQLPDPARLSFEVTGQAKRFNYSASADLVWRHDGSHYQARQEVSLFLLGSRSQASEGRLTDLGLEPARFDDKARKLQTAHLDFSAGQAHFSDGAPDAPITPGAQDRLSVFLQLSALLAAAPQRYPAGTQISFITVSARRADRWTFRVGATETLELPAGSMPALRLDKVRQGGGGDGGDGQQASLWLAPALQYLPARIRLEQDNGDFADLQLKEKTAP